MVTRQSIIEGASAVFAASGYGSASLTEIAESSQVTKGALYFHFKSKEGLASSIIEAQHTASMTAVNEILTEGRSALETIIRSTGSFAGQLLKDAVVQAGIRLTFDVTDFGIDVTKPYADWITVMENLIHRGIGEGQIRAEISATKLARYIVGSFTGVQLLSGVLAGRSDLIDRVEDMWTFLLPTIVAPESAAQLASLPSLVRNYG